jgi:hypothetical protein
MRPRCFFLYSISASLGAPPFTTKSQRNPSHGLDLQSNAEICNFHPKNLKKYEKLSVDYHKTRQQRKIALEVKASQTILWDPISAKGDSINYEQ